MKLAGQRLAGAVLLAGALGHASPVSAAEGGVSFWLPGQAVPEAGILPPPGVFFDSTGYFYSAHFSASRSTRLGGNIAADVKIDLKADFATALWVTPWEIFGGSLAFGLVVPWGDPAVRAGLVLDGPVIDRRNGGPLAIGARDSGVTVGDPILSGSLGWHSGKWHWKVSTALNIPAGAYEPGQLSNLAPNRFIGDQAVGVSYLDPELGIDLSGAAGFTFNGENRDTHYRTGTEFHLDLSATKFLTKDFSVGVIASHYEQITGDSGSGATLGPFRGRVTALGGHVGYDFKLGDLPVSAKVKLLREVEVKNRFQGTIGFVELSFPLWVAPPRATEAQAIPAKY